MGEVGLWGWGWFPGSFTLPGRQDDFCVRLWGLVVRGLTCNPKAPKALPGIHWSLALRKLLGPHSQSAQAAEPRAVGLRTLRQPAQAKLPVLPSF